MKAVTVFIIFCMIAAPLNAQIPKAQAENNRSSAAPDGTAVTLPEGTMVKLRLMRELSSATIRGTSASSLRSSKTSSLMAISSSSGARSLRERLWKLSYAGAGADLES
jgi:hypothetical protein